MAKAERIHLPLSRLQTGITVKLPLSWTDHPFLFNRIEIKDAGQIEMIRNLGVPYVILISDEDLLNDVIEEENEAQQATERTKDNQPDPKASARKAIRKSQGRFLNAINDCRTVVSKLVSDPEGAIREASALVEQMLDHLLESGNPKLALVSSGEGAPSVTQHGISVAVLALMIGHSLELSKDKLRDIALGALLHDIGKLKVPDAIRRKRNPLSQHESNFLSMHPNFGYDMLKRSGLFGNEVLHIVKHHHEFIDGSGYPDRLKLAKLPLTTQIVALANDYDSQLARQEIVSPQIALGYLFKNRVGKHQEQLISALVKVLGIYPPGTLVSLSDNNVGKVMMTTSEVRQPQVWACKNDGSEPKLRFLMDEEVSVEAVLKSEELTEGASRTLQAGAGISFYFSALE
ncbi:HD-GYP domain-containing protein [Shewanella indica]|uniref:DUF3391 domain-containing protein n=1 Tax=Shewanella indica TaxID=768528 RepID=A0ABU4QDJ2_9GAMM|nr:MULTISPECIES: HD domain-containing phosphohydrolase [Shewanella]NDO72922.1 DUF3391 domain-containing protein [Shewanella sp. SE1]OIN16308.1 phosphohydrolase [Shewanella algae]MDX6017487.1 DUF3391 domain-containing protein [Shewanella indica]TVP13946.1 phosphohydrolase [Shewanella sp. MSW]GHB06969.1 phosphohydrolase [Shewanella indica]